MRLSCFVYGKRARVIDEYSELHSGHLWPERSCSCSYFSADHVFNICSAKSQSVGEAARRANRKDIRAASDIYYQIHANLVFRRVSFRKGSSRKCWQLPISYHSLNVNVYLVFQLFQTRVAHFCFCLVRIKMTLLIC